MNLIEEKCTLKSNISTFTSIKIILKLYCTNQYKKQIISALYLSEKWLFTLNQNQLVKAFEIYIIWKNTFLNKTCIRPIIAYAVETKVDTSRTKSITRTANENASKHRVKAKHIYLTTIKFKNHPLTQEEFMKMHKTLFIDSENCLNNNQEFHVNCILIFKYLEIEIRINELKKKMKG